MRDLFSMPEKITRVHRTIRATPAMEAGITDHVWRLAGRLAD
ncbi:MAG TPA: hypothetical protein VFL57_01715 [Bryobacteraceae bacterium]|nr:hypothetical protein [Bryobacteraceae bacterium]